MSSSNDSKVNNLLHKQNNFLQSIKVKENKEVLRIKELKRKYDMGEISENEISDEDAKKIIKIYDEEIKNIRKENKTLKDSIKKELEKLKKNPM